MLILVYISSALELEHELHLVQTGASVSSIASDATAPNLPGPGRNIGNLFDWLGAHLYLEHEPLRTASRLVGSHPSTFFYSTSNEFDSQSLTWEVPTDLEVFPNHQRTVDGLYLRTHPFIP